VEVMRWRWFGDEVLSYYMVALDLVSSWCGRCRVIEFFIRYLIL
jgi:hypothetical protein